MDSGHNPELRPVSCEAKRQEIKVEAGSPQEPLSRAPLLAEMKAQGMGWRHDGPKSISADDPKPPGVS
jgi:hypothetical protein